MAVETHIQDKLQDGYHALMLGYASGCLDGAQSLIVSTHISMSSQARDVARHYEGLGGALLEKECKPVAMSSASLDQVLMRLDDGDQSDDRLEYISDFPEGLDVPNSLRHSLADQKQEPVWTSLYPGLKTFELDLACKSSKARFLKADPALKTPHHTHGGTEITLILDGAFEDETGKYSVGDLIVTDEDCHHSPVACPEMGCICMVVSTAPIKLTGVARLLNPFIRV